MTAPLHGRVALVTGGGQGIGAEIAVQLAKAGAGVVVGDLRRDAAEAIAREIGGAGGRAIGTGLDVTRSDQVAEFVGAGVAEFGRVDILVNNAGVIRDALLHNMTEEEFDDVVRVHLKGTFLCMQAATREMRHRGYGKVVNISSIAGKVGNIGQANYAAAKAGIVALTKTAAKELARHGICVNAIQPGFIETPMTRSVPEKVRDMKLAEVPLGRFGQPIDIARPAVFLASDDSDYMTGAVLEVTGGRYM
jgi:3-oxoacyl-[acyl-carrier protein] reductase